ncbi:MAG: tRNA preQ1(34) S-adenosylmethionine ribosyltransferase-isomerase QueA [Candidatus Omnitrophica bacterium]|nr:tRNA preQ1(34) S-adenosylmethionine ribosyltransferase-isomerase QueA [Candidatus Omnitrophota bacterium]
MTPDKFKLSSYNFNIPKSLIAQEPVRPRDSSRILVLDCKKKLTQQMIFSDILSFFNPGDVLVLNNTEVIKARLIGQKAQGLKVELLLLKEVAKDTWEALVKPGRRLRPGDRIIFVEDKFEAEVVGRTDQGGRLIKFYCSDFKKFLDQFGEMPLPHYIKKKISKPEDYQTIYARQPGAVAAPTAGLHFTKELLSQLKDKGTRIVNVTLHCGLATFRPVKTDDIRNHKIESEWIDISKAACDIINSAKQTGRKVFAVGTTAIRTLETVSFLDSKAEANYQVKPFCGETSLYIVPGYKFRIVDAVITNFHTPCSSNLILMSSFCGLAALRKSYLQAATSKFRFFSFGDAMLII